MADWYTGRWRPRRGGLLTNARLLLLIRDGVARTWDELLECLGYEARNPDQALHGAPSSTAESVLISSARNLQRAGLLEFPDDSASAHDYSQAPQGRLQISAHLHTTLSSLGLSLAEVADLTSRSMVIHPWFGKPNKPTRRVDVFVAMPFAPESKSLYDDHIVPAVESAGMTAARADEFWGSSHVMSEIWSLICGARLVIADCSTRNPNVFYELGVAHTVGRPVLLIAQDISDVPFDVRHLRVLQYQPGSYMSTFRTQLERAIHQAVQESSDRTA